MSLRKPGIVSAESAWALAVILSQCDKWEESGTIGITCEYAGVDGLCWIDFLRFVNQDSDYTDLDPSSSTYGEVFAAFESLAFSEVTGDGDGGGGLISVDVKAHTITRSEYYVEPSRVYVSQDAALR